MKLSFSFNGNKYTSDLKDPIDLSIPIRPDSENINAFYANDPIIKAFEMGDFIGSVKQGSPVNTNDISFNVHGNVTHTECIGHLTEELNSVHENIKEYILPALLVTLDPEKIDDDLQITVRTLKDACKTPLPKALIIRTNPNGPAKLKRRYSGTNPAYINPEAMKWILENGVDHLLLDLPSVDPEQDNGMLTSHKIFWNFNGKRRVSASITELIYVDNDISDGLYVLNLQIAPFHNDASPSRPILYHCQHNSK